MAWRRLEKYIKKERCLDIENYSSEIRIRDLTCFMFIAR